MNFIVQLQLLFHSTLIPAISPQNWPAFSNSAWDQLSLDGTESFSLREKDQSSIGSKASQAMT